jgi:hypothetical protein
MSELRDSPLPEIVLLNRQRRVPLATAPLLRFARRALALCARESADGLYALRSLEEVVVTLVSDRRIDKIHRQFMAIPGRYGCNHF